MADQSPLNYSRTQRIVLLVDLCPLLHLHDHSTYLQSLLSSVRLLLSFPPLSGSLFSYKLLFSSLSPILSSSAILKLLSKTAMRSSCNSNSLSFDRPGETLASLSETLSSISDLSKPIEFDSAVAKADFVASSMLQLVHDYAWEVQVEQDLLGTSFDSGDLELSSGLVRSNLIVLFSPICKSVVALRDYMGVDCDENGDLNHFDLFRDRFIRTFGHVASSFSMRDIHLCWVDMSYELECGVKEVQSDESMRSLELFQHGVKKLGWGFCSTGSIVLGSALVPFGLIYPTIGVISNYCDPSDYQRIAGQLNLEISDVKGRPLQCKCCDLQLLGLKALHKMEHADLMRNWKSLQLKTESDGKPKTLWEFVGDGRVQIDIRSIHRYKDVKKHQHRFYDAVLVRELSGASNRNIEDSSSECVADKVLQILMKDTTSSCVERKFVPIWQILLSFLYRGGYWALVNISKSDDSSCMGLLKPFSTNSSLLYLIKEEDSNQIQARDSDRLNGRKPKDELDEHGVNENTSHSTLRDERKRKIRKHSQKSNDLSWSLFSKEALCCSHMELEEAYFSTSSDTSKKLKFLKCWMKQVSQSNYRRHCRPHQPKQHADMKEMLGERVRVVHGESEQPLSSSFPQVEDLVPDNSHTQQGTHSLFSESSESFFSSLPERIEHGLESGVDLLAFAQRILKSSICLLKKKLELPGNREVLGLAEVSDGNNYGAIVASELIKILLKAPKDLSGKHKDNELSSQGNGSVTVNLSSEYKIREYELQILFRMEILQSEYASHVKKSTKQKLVKQTCSFLEFIQCNMEGGFFGDFNLSDYVETLILNRYKETLGDVIHQIYERMDLLLFQDEEDESPNLLLNSEDSNHSWRERLSRENSASDHNDRTSGAPSSEDSTFPWGTPGIGTNRTRDHKNEPAEEKHTRMADEARERRERARRFSSFTRGVLDLQRVFAPKHSKLSKSKSGSLLNPSRKSRDKRERYDKVCETPESGEKSIDNNAGQNGSRGSPARSVYKALFQDD